MDSQELLAQVGLGTAIGLGAACFAGLFEQELRDVSGNASAILLRQLIVVNGSLETFWGRVKDFFRAQLAVNGRLDSQSVVYRVIGSALYLIFFSAFTFSDFHLLALSLVAAGIDAGHFNPPMGAGTLTALSVIAGVLFWGAVISDLMGMTNTAPWIESLNARWRRCLLIVAIICLGLSLVVTGSMGLYRGKVIADEASAPAGFAKPSTEGITDLAVASSPANTIEPVTPERDSELYYWIPIVANVCIPVLVLAGGVFSSWGLVMVIKFLILLAGFIVLSPLWLVWLGASIALNIVDRLDQFLDAVLRLFAAVGRAILRLFGWKGGPPKNPGGGTGPKGPDDTDPSSDNSGGGSCGNDSGSEKGPPKETQETIKPSSDGWDPFGK